MQVPIFVWGSFFNSNFGSQKQSGAGNVFKFLHVMHSVNEVHVMH